MSSGSSSAFAGFWFPREMIAVAIRWYLPYGRPSGMWKNRRQGRRPLDLPVPEAGQYGWRLAAL